MSTLASFEPITFHQIRVAILALSLGWIGVDSFLVEFFIMHPNLGQLFDAFVLNSMDCCVELTQPSVNPLSYDIFISNLSLYLDFGFSVLRIPTRTRDLKVPFALSN